MSSDLAKKKKAEAYYKKYLKLIYKKLGNGITYADDLTTLGMTLFGSLFKGVYSADTIPKLNKGEFIIVNNEPKSKSGEHWLLAVKTHSNKVYLYDSFGRKHYRILPTLNQSGNGAVIDTENDPEQQMIQEDCGQRCLAAAMVYHNLGGSYFKWI